MITFDNVVELKSNIKIELEKCFPYTNIYISTLGGERNASVMFTISLDEKKHWNHGIIDNSRISKFAIHQSGLVYEVENFIPLRIDRKKYAMRSFKTSESRKVIEKLNLFFDIIIAEHGVNL